jgi:hypothetical protein
MGDACRQQGRAWLQKLLVFAHDQLSHGATIDQLSLISALACGPQTKGL